MNAKEISQDALKKHMELEGKIRITATTKLETAEQLATYYTPGVGAVSSYLSKHPEEVGRYTIARNTVAVISDGSAVLGLGNVGPEAALPVMEGKAMLFSELSGLNAFPIVLNTQKTEKIIETIICIAPVFAAINLEDIAAPACFEIEKQLQQKLMIPVVHDDQHATAIAVLAGLINALKVVGKTPQDSRATILGAGAAGNAVARLLVAFGLKDVVVTDSKGIISQNREDLDEHKQELAKLTNTKNIYGEAIEAARDADVVIGLTTGGEITSRFIKNMNDKPIVFALANPVPEIMPADAIAAGAAVVATGRSDFANQINNVLVFPGLFKGLIDTKQRVVTNQIKIAAAVALAGCVSSLSRENIIPSVFDGHVVPAITHALVANSGNNT